MHLADDFKVPIVALRGGQMQVATLPLLNEDMQPADPARKQINVDEALCAAIVAKSVREIVAQGLMIDSLCRLTP